MKGRRDNPFLPSGFCPYLNENPADSVFSQDTPCKVRSGSTSDLSANVEVGTHEVIVTFIERSWGASNNATGNGRVTGMPRIGLGVEIEGPFNPSGLSLSESREKIFVCQPAELAEERFCAAGFLDPAPVHKNDVIGKPSCLS